MECLKVPFNIAIVDTTGGQTKLKKQEYLDQGKFPIIDQGQGMITSYTNNDNAIYKGSLPVILFGDHTRIFKYINFPFVLGADGVKVLTVNQNWITKYIYYYFLSFEIPSQGYSRHFKYLKEYQIPLPPLSEQKRIVEILDQADELRKKRTQADTISEGILPALFIKMFGDPATNPNNFLVEPLGNSLNKFESGVSFKPIADDSPASQWRVLKISAVTSGTFKPSESKPISPDTDISESLIVRQGDLLMSRANTKELVGAISRVRNQPPQVLLSDKLWRFKFSENSKLHPDYILYALRQPYFRFLISSLASGTGGAMKNISKASAMTLPIPIPPYDLQEKFSQNVILLEEKLKNQQNRTNQKINLLFQTLLHQAFSGELTAKWRQAHLSELLEEMEHQAKTLNIDLPESYHQLSLNL